MARYANPRPTERQALRDINNRAKAGYVLKKQSAHFNFYQYGNTSERWCKLPNKCFIIVRKIENSRYFGVEAYLVHSNPDELPDEQKRWLDLRVTGKNHMHAIAKLLGKLYWFFNPIEKCWMNYYDVCKPHIVFYDNPRPKTSINIPTQTRINDAARQAKLNNSRLLIID